MDINSFVVQELDFDAICAAFEKLPNADLAKSLLQIWAFLRFEFPLPVFIFDHKLVINTSPSRRDLNSSFPILQSLEKAELAIAALEQIGLVQRVRQYDGHEYIRMTNYFNLSKICLHIAEITDEKILEGKLDFTLLEVGRLLCSIYPKPNLVFLMDLLVERLHSQAIWYTSQLIGIRRPAPNLLPELKEFANSDDFLCLLISTQYNPRNDIPDRQRWKVYNYNDALKRRLPELKAFLDDLQPPSTHKNSFDTFTKHILTQFTPTATVSERSPFLQFVWQVVSCLFNPSEETDMLLLGMIEDHLEQNAHTLSAADWVFCTALKLMHCSASPADSGLPSVAQCLQRMMSYKRDPSNTALANIPGWYDIYVCLFGIWFVRHVCPPQQLHIDVLMHEMERLAAADGFEKSTLMSRMPFLEDVRGAAKFMELVVNEDADESDFEEYSEYLLRNTARLSPRGVGPFVLRLFYSRRFSFAPMEERLKVMDQMMQDALEFYGSFCPELAPFIIETIQDVGEIVQAAGTKLTPRMGEWIKFAHKICRYLRPTEEIRFIDACVRLSGLSASLEEKPRLEIFSEAVISSLNGKLYDKISVCDICVHYILQGYGRDDCPDATLESFVEMIQSTVDGITVSQSAKDAIALAVTVNAMRAVFSVRRGQIDASVMHFERMLVVHSRSNSAVLAQLLMKLVPIITGLLMQHYDETNLQSDSQLATALVFSCDFFFFVLATKVFDVQDEVEEDVKTLLRTWLSRLKKAGYQTYVDSMSEKLKPRFDEEFIASIDSVGQPMMRITTGDDDEAPEKKSREGDKTTKKGKKTSKKSRSPSGLSSQLLVVGGAAGLAGVLGAIGLIFLFKSR